MRAHDEQGQRNDGGDSRRRRFQPQGEADRQRRESRIHRMANQVIGAGVYDVLAALGLQANDDGREGVVQHGGSEEPPTGDEERESEGTDARSRPREQMEPEDIFGNEDNVGAKRQNERQQQDAVDDWLALLHGGLVALVEEALGRGEDRDRGGSQVYAEEYPSAAPVERARRGEKQKGEKSPY